MERAEYLKKNHKRKFGKLQKILNHTAVLELLPLNANSLKREHYKHEGIEKQVALEIARKFGVVPRNYVDNSFTFG